VPTILLLLPSFSLLSSSLGWSIINPALSSCGLAVVVLDIATVAAAEDEDDEDDEEEDAGDVTDVVVAVVVAVDVVVGLWL
jgi:hypothetical protein